MDDDDDGELGHEGLRLLNEIGRQVVEGVKRGESVIEVRLTDEHNAGLKNLGKAGGFLMIACAYLDKSRAQLPKSLTHVRIHWPSGWGVDLVPMQRSN